MELYSKREAIIGNPEGEICFNLSNWKKFHDNSRITCKLYFKNKHFEVRNFDIYFDVELFKNYLPELKNIFENLEGELSIGYPYEDNIVHFKATTLGHIELTCNLNVFDSIAENVSIGFEIDQSYLNNFINSLNEIYSDLGI